MKLNEAMNSMDLKGTKFQLRVWNYLRKIPRGSVKTYSQVAKAIGKPLAVRAVANAIGKNPSAPRIPCHRVIRSDGSLGGYSGKGGIKTKKLLLKNEGITL
jgi:methylated-DNA-[protein]-cysteine S-methyltransferase